MMRRWLILNGVLVVIVLGLTFQIVRTWARTLRPVEVTSGGKGADVPARGGEGGKKSKRGAAEKTAPTPAALVTAIVTKELFDPTRTKQSEEAKVQAPPTHEPPPIGVTLAGIRILGKDREAFIIDASQANSQRRIRPGDAVGNFTVKAIKQRSVLLVSPAGDLATLTLEVEKSKAAAAAPAARRPLGPVAAAAANAPPAAGVKGGSPAAGSGGAKPAPVTAAGTAARAPAPPAPGVPPVPVPTTLPLPAAGKPGQPQMPQLPAGVREKIEQMKKDRKQ